jgi:vacuolar iron transporter family protein
MRNPENHFAHRTGWLRASVLGANDGIVSTASIILGVTAAHSSHHSIVLAGLASLIGGATAMAAGEYVSVSSQADTERADLDRERLELAEHYDLEVVELADIYIARGLDAALAQQVAIQLMNHDALGAHARDELGITETLSARPVQAALASAGSFAVGAALPLMLVFIIPRGTLVWAVSTASLIFLALLGSLAARTGGAPIGRATARVMFWGALAMALTAAVGACFGTIP